MAVRRLIWLLLLLGCGAPSPDYSGRPYPEIVPAPYAKWCRCPAVYIDYVVYDGSEAMSERLREVVPPIIAEIRAYSAAHGLTVRMVETAAAADVTFRFYENPCRTAQEDVRRVIDGGPVRDLLEINSRAATAYPPVPPTECYCGIAYPTVRRGCLQAVGVWLNVAGCNGIPNDHMAGYLDKVIWHESGHAFWGLQDVYGGAVPGLMNYSLMTTRPSVYEEAVIGWLYGG